MRAIAPDDLVPLDDLARGEPLRVHLPYADAAHPDNIFKTAIYRRDARLWVHRALAPVVITAAQLCHADCGLIFEVKDGLRTVEAQEKMMQTDIVRAHPEWTQEPDRMLAPPGHGAHPRAMAVDIVLVDDNGVQADMGTPFDYLSKTDPRAARAFTGLAPDVLARRQLLERCMVEAGKIHGHAIVPLPQEWWDFRFARDYTNGFAPLYDRDLPPAMRMTEG